MNIRLAPAELIFLLNDSGTKVLCVDSTFAPMLKAFQGKLETVEQIVSGENGHAHAILVRALEPVIGTEIMQQKFDKTDWGLGQGTIFMHCTHEKTKRKAKKYKLYKPLRISLDILSSLA